MHASRFAALAGPAARADRTDGPAADAASPEAALDRRGFLKAAVAAGGGLALSWIVPGTAHAQAVGPKALAPAPFLTIRPDNTVEILANRLDFGQGAATALPMLVAEELDLDWAQVRGGLAPAGDAYRDPVFGLQMTGGSTSVAHSWEQYRRVGATARAMLVQAAAAEWGVLPARVRTERGHLLADGRRAPYARFAEAAAALPVPVDVALKDPSRYTIIGTPRGRHDAAQTVRGRKAFGIDRRLPGQVVAVVARPPTFGGRVASFDASKALSVRGVRAVFEVPTDRGGTGVAVVADGYWPAKTARDALVVQWRDGASSGLDSARQRAEYRAEALAPKHVAQAADVAAVAAAPRRIVAEYAFPYLAHAPMEPLNAVVDLRADRCVVHSGTQFQTVDQAAVAEVVGLKPEQVALFTEQAGGGFGRRAVPSSDYLREAAGVARAWNARGAPSPVQVIWSREDDIRGGYYRPAHLIRAEVGLDAGGRVLGIDYTIVGQSIVKGTPFEAFLVKDGVDGTTVEGAAGSAYDLPMRVRVSHPEVGVPVLWWRSVGHPHNAFAMETLVDEIARAANVDPVAFRRERLARHPRHLAALDLAVSKSGYGSRRLPAGRAWGVAVHESFGSVVAYVVEVSVRERRPVVHRVTAGVHANRIVNPTMAEAQVQGACIFGLSTTLPGNAITFRDGRVEQSQFSDYTPARMPDAPPIDVHFVPSDAPPTGLGEPGTPPIAPAIANAVAALTGQRLRSLPFEPLPG